MSVHTEVDRAYRPVAVTFVGWHDKKRQRRQRSDLGPSLGGQRSRSPLPPVRGMLVRAVVAGSV